MLRTRYALDINRVGEIAEILICLADTIVLRMVAILDISYTPGIIAHKLEGRATFAILLSLETYIIILYRFAPTMIQILAGSGVDTRSFHPLS